MNDDLPKPKLLGNFAQTFDLTQVNDFVSTDWNPIDGLGAGQMTNNLYPDYLAPAVGLFQDTVEFNGFSANASAPYGIAQNRRLIILANVYDNNGTVPEPGALLLMAMAGLVLQHHRSV